MKKIYKLILFLCLVCIAVILSLALSDTSLTQAANSSQVKYNLKNGVLTIKGNGEMPADMTFIDNPDITRVIIKEGITKVSDKAFLNCENLEKVSLPNGLESIGVKSFSGTAVKKVVVPDSVKEIGQQAVWNCRKLKYMTMPGDFTFKEDEREPDEYIERILTCMECGDFAPKTITFTTPLKIENITMLSAKNYIVSKDDPNYKSVKGVVYSKDGTELIRVPSERKTLRVSSKCKKIYLSSFMYKADSEDDFMVTKLTRLYLPKGKCEVEIKNELDKDVYRGDAVVWINAEGTELDGKAIELLAEYCGYDFFGDFNPEWFDGFKDLVNILDNDCAVTWDGIVIKYIGDGGDVVLDEKIKGIGKEAFARTAVTSVKIPENIEYIGDRAFALTSELGSIKIPANATGFGNYIFDQSGIKKITFEDGIKTIPDSICFHCLSLTTVNMPESVEKIGDGAFMYCTSFNLGKYSGFASLPNLTQIGSRAFYYCNFSNVVLPEKITEVGENAFWGRDAKKGAKITVMGDTSGYSPLAFGGFINVEYKKGIECELVNIKFSSTSYYSNRAGRYTVKFVWNVTSDVDGIEVEISENSNFSTVYKGKALTQKAEKDEASGLVVYVSVDDVKAPAAKEDIFWMNNMFVRARVFKDADGTKETREYSRWNCY